MQQGHCNQGMLARGLVPKKGTGSELSRLSNSRYRPADVPVPFFFWRSKTPRHGPTGRPGAPGLTGGSLRTYSVRVLSGGKAGRRVYLKTI